MLPWYTPGTYAPHSPAATALTRFVARATRTRDTRSHSRFRGRERDVLIQTCSHGASAAQRPFQHDAMSILARLFRERSGVRYEKYEVLRRSARPLGGQTGRVQGTDSCSRDVIGDTYSSGLVLGSATGT